MAKATSINSLPQSTLEEKFSALEAKFAALEKNYHDLHEKALTSTENSTSESTANAVPQVFITTSNNNI